MSNLMAAIIASGFILTIMLCGYWVGRTLWESSTPLATMFLYCISMMSFGAIIVAYVTHKEFDGGGLIVTMMMAVAHTIGMKISTMRK